MRVGSNSVPIPMGCGLHYHSVQYLWFVWCQQPFKWQINDLGTQSFKWQINDLGTQSFKWQINDLGTQSFKWQINDLGTQSFKWQINDLGTQSFKWQINDLGTQSLTGLGIRKSVVRTTRQSEETKNARRRKKGKCEILVGEMQDACKKY